MFLIISIHSRSLTHPLGRTFVPMRNFSFGGWGQGKGKLLGYVLAA